jgi:hypothetical protein
MTQETKETRAKLSSSELEQRNQLLKKLQERGELEMYVLLY